MGTNSDSFLRLLRGKIKLNCNREFISFVPGYQVVSTSIKVSNFLRGRVNFVLALMCYIVFLSSAIAGTTITLHTGRLFPG